ncbi:unnamed protein product [Brassicogethes aeneus]|uniref:2-(3-amino-3-carboxypropyl)histidine synthase n=1 Tax=Brassicogethes aeneus TaxID=1431903 RepID=A0A9P0AUV8_BRAAE|nr:unnamed protein product [Brassicogethes aeneus]
MFKNILAVARNPYVGHTSSSNSQTGKPNPTNLNVFEMTRFSTNEAVSLEKTVETAVDLVETSQTDLENVYEIGKCAEWIKKNNYKKVCLQFPDYLLPDSTEVALKLQEILGQTLYILGDTAYESCCIDYIAASHINADAIIHFGAVCFSITSANIPHMNIYEKGSLNVVDLKKSFDTFEGNKSDIILLVDTPYICHLDTIKEVFSVHKNVVVSRIDESVNNNQKITVFLGDNDRKLMNLSLSMGCRNLYYYKPKVDNKMIVKYEMESKIIKRRYFLMEKIKDSNTVGIVVGTLAVKNYLKVIERIKRLLNMCGKKYYLISVGKPTVAKLANFPEVDLYVIITCAMNEIYESRDYYKPIVTPYDVEVALNVNSKNLNFTYDYNSFINDSDLDSLEVNLEEDVSLLSGNVRRNKTDDEKMEDSEHNLISLRAEGTVAHSDHGAGFLASRSWRGLEQNLGGTDAKLAEEGRKGIAQGYSNEKM